MVQECRTRLEVSAKDQIDRARLIAVSAPHAGDWLKAVPILHLACGLMTIQYALLWVSGWDCHFVPLIHVLAESRLIAAEYMGSAVGQVQVDQPAISC